MLRYEFAKHAPIKDIRLVRDKFTHVSRGFAFVHFYSVEDATKALEATHGMTLERNGQVVRVAYAKSIHGPGTGGPQSSSLAAAAIEAATFAQQVLEADMAILDEIDSGLDVDALQDVAKAVNNLLTPHNSVLMIIHYQRLLDFIRPSYVHIMLKLVVTWIRSRVTKADWGTIFDSLDEEIRYWEEEDTDKALELLDLAISCTQLACDVRPSMREVVGTLERMKSKYVHPSQMKANK